MPGRPRRDRRAPRRSVRGRARAPGEDSIPAESHAVDCAEIADRVARELREHDEARGRAASATYRSDTTFTVTLVPEECADEMDARGVSSS